MPGPLLPALITAGASLAGQGITAAAQGSMNKKTRKWNEKMYQTQRAHALADRAFENEYNSPAAFMARLEAAGLNKNLIYGEGTIASGSNTRNTDFNSWNPRAAQFDLGAAAGAGLGAYYDTQLKQATIDNMAVQKTVAEMDAMLKAAQTLSTLTGRDKTAQDIQIAGDLKAYTLDQARANVNRTLAETKSTLDENERRAALQQPTLLKAAEEVLTMRLGRTKTRTEIEHIKQQIENLKKDGTLKQLDINLKKDGIQPGDPAWLRMLSTIVDTDKVKTGVKEYGKTMQQIYKSRPWWKVTP